MHTALFTMCGLVIALCRFVHSSKGESTICGMGIQKIVRHCPDLALISAYLRETCQVVKDVTKLHHFASGVTSAIFGLPR